MKTTITEIGKLYIQLIKKLPRTIKKGRNINRSSKYQTIRDVITYSIIPKMITFAMLCLAVVLFIKVNNVFKPIEPVNQNENKVVILNYTYPEKPPKLITHTKIEETTTTNVVETETTSIESTEIIETTTIESTTSPSVVETTTTEEITEPSAVISDNEEPIEISENDDMTYLGDMKITGYVATGNLTASGDYPYVGGVALSNDYGLPYGTQIYIEGLGYYTINDTGCRYGVVDIFCNTVDECYALTSYAEVYIVN